MSTEPLLTQHKVTVLLIDDQPMIGEAVRRMLVSSLTKLAMNSSCPYADGWPWTAWEVASCVGGDQSN